MTIEVELKRAFKTGKVLLGINETEKSILLGKAKGIVVSADLRKLDFLRLKHLCRIGKVPFLAVEYVPIEIGRFIGVSYPVSALSVLDQGKSKAIQEIEFPTEVKKEVKEVAKKSKKAKKKEEAQKQKTAKEENSKDKKNKKEEEEEDKEESEPEE